MKKYYIKNLKNIEEFAPGMSGKIYRGIEEGEYIKIFEPNDEEILFLKNEVIELIEIENLNHGQCIAFIKDRIFGKVRKVHTTFFSGLGKTGKIEMLKTETIEGYHQYIF